MATAAELSAQMDAIIVGAGDRSLTSEEVTSYSNLERDLNAISASDATKAKHAAWQRPRVSVQPPSVVKGSRDDGRYAFDQFLRGDNGAAREIASYSASDEGRGSQAAAEKGAKLLRWPINSTAQSHADMVAQYAQTETTTAGGYLVPTITADVLVKVRKAFGGISAKARHIQTNNGAPLNFPSIDDTANSSVIAAINTAAGSAGADLVFGQVAMGAFKYAATGTGNAGLKVPVELIQDSMFDITGLVTEMLGVRLARKMAADYAQGTGTTMPVGLFDVTSPITALSGGLVQATANAQLQTFIHTLDPAYVDENCCWIFSWGTHGTISGFVDSTNRPLLKSYGVSGLESGLSFSLLGYPVQLDQGSPAFSLTASANPASVNTSYAAFGDIYESYVIRDVAGIGIAVDPYTGLGANNYLYYGYARSDAQIRNRNAYILLAGYHA